MYLLTKHTKSYDVPLFLLYGLFAQFLYIGQQFSISLSMLATKRINYVLLFMLVWLAGCQSNHTKLIRGYLEEPFRAPQVANSGDTENDAAWNKGVALYEKRDYKGAAKAFLSVAWDPYFTGSANFYAGLCSLYLPNADGRAAIPLLQKAVGQTTNRRDDAQWYLALAYLLHKNEKGQQLLYRMAESFSHRHVDEATKLIDAVVRQ